MLNKIWPMFIISSIIYAIIFGDINSLNNGIFSSCENTVKLCLTFLGTISLWNGIMNIASKTSFINKISKLLKPIMRFLFPKIKEDGETYNCISMNIIANILGLGNASTPLGLKAMNELQKENDKKDTLSDSMAMLIIINTASIQIIPTTVIAIRTSMNSRKSNRIYSCYMDFIHLCIISWGIICKMEFVKKEVNKCYVGFRKG